MAPPLSRLDETPLALQALVDGAKDGIVIVGVDGRIEDANHRAAALVGLDAPALIGRSFESFFGSEIRDVATDCFESAKRGRDVLEVTRLEAVDGRSEDIEVRARRIEDGRVLAVLRDAGDLRRHQRALRIVSTALSVSPGQPFFQAVVLALVRALPIDHAFVGELVEPERTTVDLHAFSGPVGPEPAVTYELAGTPCDVALRERRSVFTANVAEDFPDDDMLIELGVRTYHAVPLLDAGGTPLGILGILNREPTPEDRLTTSILDLVASRAAAEISGQRTERERRRAERNLRALVQASSRFVWGVDHEGHATLDAGNTWREMTGDDVDPTEAAEWIEAVVPDDRNRVWAEWRAAFEKKREFGLAYRVATAEGVRHLKVRGVPIHDDDGTFEGYIGTFDDVTELHRAAENLKRRNDVLRMLRAVPEATHNGAGFIESIQVGLSEVCRASVFELGRLRMQGSPRGDFEDTGLTCGPHSLDAGRVGLVSPLDSDRALAERVAAGEVPVWVERCSIERRARGEGGQASDEHWHGPCAAVFVPVRFAREPVAILELLASEPVEADETLTEVLAQMAIQLSRSYERDLNQRQMREAERKARESQKLEAVGRLAGGIAHDFNNLLMVVLGEAELALLGDGLSDSLRSALEEIRASGRRAATLTGQLLAFSRREIDNPERVDLGAVILDADRMLRRVIGENVRLDTTSVNGSEEHVVRVAKGLIEQVVLNLVVNAREAMPEGGDIRIGLRRERVDPTDLATRPDAEPGDYVVLSVSDTGTGIPDDILENIFEPFFTTKLDGTGFGLSTSYGIVTSAGGFIDVDSEIGVGSEFRVHLPAVGGDAAGAQADGTPGNDERKAGRVLIVEDDHAVRSVATRILSMAGYQVAATDGGAGVLEYVRSVERAPDVLLTDCVLQNETGRDIDEMVRRAFPEVGTVFMSGYTDDVLLRQGVHPSGGAFLPKPFSPDALITAVERVFAEAGRLGSPEAPLADGDAKLLATAPPEGPA